MDSPSPFTVLESLGEQPVCLLSCRCAFIQQSGLVLATDPSVLSSLPKRTQIQVWSCPPTAAHSRALSRWVQHSSCLPWSKPSNSLFTQPAYIAMPPALVTDPGARRVDCHGARLSRPSDCLLRQSSTGPQGRAAQSLLRLNRPSARLCQFKIW